MKVDGRHRRRSSAGAKLAVVKGDPTKTGEFVVRAKFPANYTVPPHHHPTDEVVRVMGPGTLAYGMGDKVDASNSGALSKGYHITMRSGMNHWVQTTDPLEIEVAVRAPSRSATSIRATTRATNSLEAPSGRLAFGSGAAFNGVTP